MVSSFLAACIQLNSKRDIELNFAEILQLVDEALELGAEFITLPECTGMMEPNRKLLKEKTPYEQDHSVLIAIRERAMESGAWILIGSLAIRLPGNHIVNRSYLIDEKGEIAATYDKIHMFDVNLSNKEKHLESETYSPGKKIEVIDLPWGKLGMSICYDIRFPNMYRKMSQMGAKFISVPSAFTFTTGKKHWHVLLKARAIENFCYVFAPAQYGNHYSGRKTFGHSLIVSPDGEILCELDTGEGIISCSIDPSLPYKLREKIPSINVD